MNPPAEMSPPTAPVATETRSMISDPSHLGTLGSNVRLKAATPNSTGCTWLVVLAAIAASLSGLMLGYELGLTSGVLLQLRGILSLSCREQELLVGSLLLGCLVISIVGGWGLDRYGRRWSMLLSGGLVAGGTMLLLLPASLTTLSLGRAVVGMGTALSVVYVVLSEIFPTGVRGKAVSVVSAVNWATNLLMSMTFLSATERIGVPNVMFLYATISFILLVFVILFIPETQGRTLEQISKELAKKKQLKVRFWRRVQPQETLFTIHRTPELSTLNPHPLT